MSTSSLQTREGSNGVRAAETESERPRRDAAPGLMALGNVALCELARTVAGDTARPAGPMSIARCHCGEAAGPGGECDSCRGSTADREPEHAQLDAALAATAAAKRGAAGSILQRTADGGTGSSCALTTYSGSNFVGQPVTADTEFTDSLDAINGHAAANDVNVHVTSSFRTTAVVPGAIVTPATMSNHMAGHAIDMNVAHGPGKSTLCNSGCLAGTRPAAVDAFIQAVRADAGLRWGGDFSDPDPVHIDDNLNADATAWTARRDATQAARTSGCG